MGQENFDELRKQIELLLQNRGNTTHTTNNTNNYTQNNYIVINIRSFLQLSD